MLKGISYGEGASSQKVAFLARVATAYSFDSIVLNASCIDDTFNRMLVAWSGIGETCVYVTSKKDEGLFLRLKQCWKIIVKSGEDVARENTGVLFINKLEELPITLCRFSKMAVRDTSVVTVGYVMKPSREEDFSKRGAFPMYPTQNGLMFVPLTFDLPLASQIQKVDVILHKATDEIVSVDPGSFLDFSKGISFSKGMQELERYIEDRPDCCVIDPLNSIYPLLDRLRIHHILLGLEDLNTKSGCRIRAPHFLKVDYFHEQNLAERLLEAQLYFPNIVKPQVACGVADAHSMAIVFRTEDFKDLRVPLPAIVQEYIDHSSLLFKFYVLGEKVFHAVKKSMPNADVLLSSSEKNGFQPIIFDSLKSLPTDNNKGQHSGNTNKQSIDVDLVTDAANWLRGRLGLTIFGFDVVVQEGSRDHVIVDVNYLPSFKEIPDNVVIPAFWDAIKSSYELRKDKYE
ncbi:inositol-tetrakisphosphate 1-kinase 6 isoform X2 [Magnolia sinica]|uniref:inositol-tetrakisphosphate 1-kinase 6 isoform X2 n=1 Tax=Magnolia sinica TaxID=86752 RepID=UPI00265A739C|nr:inositol-tetrakisphosphate 1-kinase 6 isoform X2 [Magnolia sinica]XP_058101243.1 inositol-tetrakisphosphate 1-kinase 6 isoform X2 [Magnolia sinica]